MFSSLRFARLNLPKEFGDGSFYGHGAFDMGEVKRTSTLPLGAVRPKNGGAILSPRIKLLVEPRKML